MPRAKLFINGVEKTVLEANINEEGNRAIDDATFKLPPDVVVKHNDEVHYLQDIIDLDGLVAAWNFEDTFKGEVLSGRHDGYAEGSYAWDTLDGKPALDFNGSNVRVQLGRFPHLAKFSLFTKVRVDSIPGAGTAKRLITKFDGAGADAGHIVFDLLDNGRIRLVIHDGTASRQAVSANGVIVAGNTHRLGARFDGDKMVVRVNGVEVASLTLTFSIPTYNTSWALGEDTVTGTAEWFDGLMQTAGIYDDGLTDTEFVQLEAGTKVTRAAVAYYDFSEGSGNLVHDRILVFHDIDDGGSSFTDGKLGRAFIPTGFDRFIPADQGINFNGEDTITVVVYAKSNNSNQLSKYFVVKGNHTPFSVQISPEAGRIRFNTNLGGVVANSQTATGVFNADGQEHVIICTLGKSDGSLRRRLYFDGTLLTTSGVLSGTLVDNGDPHGIGNWQTGGFRPDGHTSRILIYKGVELSQEQVTTLSNLKYLARTIKFGGRVWKYDDKVLPRVAECKSFGKELGEIEIPPHPHENLTVEFAIEEVVEDATDLEFVNAGDPAGITLTTHIAEGKCIDHIDDMAALGGKTFWVDGRAVFHLEPLQYRTVPLTFTHGVNCRVNRKGQDDSQLVNDLIVFGANKKHSTEQKFSGDSMETEFIIANVPVDIRVLVGGVEQEPEVDYTVDIDLKKITFTSPPASGTDNIVVDYSYELPIYVNASDTASIEKYGKRSKRIIAPWLRVESDGVLFAHRYVQAYKDVQELLEIEIPYLENQLEQNIVINVVDAVKGLNGQYLVKSVRYLYPSYRTVVMVGEFNFDALEAQKFVTQKIHDLEGSITVFKDFRDYVPSTAVLNLAMSASGVEILEGVYEDSNYEEVVYAD